MVSTYLKGKKAGDGGKTKSGPVMWVSERHEHAEVVCSAFWRVARHVAWTICLQGRRLAGGAQGGQCQRQTAALAWQHSSPEMPLLRTG